MSLFFSYLYNVVSGSSVANVRAAIFDEESGLTIFLNYSVLDLPRDIPVLEVVFRNYSVDDVINIARDVFDMGNIVSVKPFLDEGFIVNNGTHSLVILFDGSISYYSIKHEVGEYYPNLPEFSEAKEIANKFFKEFLEKANEYGLVPQLIELGIEASSVDYCEWYGIYSLRPIKICVNYRATYMGIEFYGNLDLRVEIGNNGKIHSLTALWRYFKPGEVIHVPAPTDETLEILLKRIKLIKEIHSRNNETLEKVVVKSVKPAYLVSSVMGKEIKPIYLFKILLIFKNGETKEITIEVPIQK